MYIFLGFFLYSAFIFVIIFHFRRKSIICKIQHMCTCDKANLLNGLIEPFGFEYDLEEDIFTTRLDVMQRQFGYTALYDNSAAFFNMVFDCEPIYFNYQERTWLIELWKGQYGINIGAEVGVYHADMIVPISARKTVLFDSINNDELLDMSVELFDSQQSLFYLQRKHWWLTGFAMGLSAAPRDLSARIAITFPNTEMMSAFTRALTAVGYTFNDYYIYDLTVYINFVLPYTKYPHRRHRFNTWLSQRENRIFLRLYHHFTRSFQDNLDRLLFLYYHFPYAFRHMCKVRIHKKRGRQ